MRHSDFDFTAAGWRWQLAPSINGHQMGYLLCVQDFYYASFRAHASAFIAVIGQCHSLIALHWALYASGAIAIIHVNLWSAPLFDSMWREPDSLAFAAQAYRDHV